MEFSVDVSRSPGNLNAILQDLSNTSAVRVGDELAKETKRTLESMTPKGKTTGALLDSIGVSRAYMESDYMKVRVGSHLSYAPLVNNGRPAGLKMPPTEIIKLWIQQKGIAVPPKMTIDRYAFLIARKIGARGTLALKFMEKSVENFRSNLR